MKGLAVIVFICLGLFVLNQTPVMAKLPKKQIVVGYNHRPPHMHHHMMPPPPPPRMVRHRNIYREHRFIDFGINYNYPYYSGYYSPPVYSMPVYTPPVYPAALYGYPNGNSLNLKMSI